MPKIRSLSSIGDQVSHFTVEIIFWEDICEHLSAFLPIVADIIVWGQSYVQGALLARKDDPALLAVLKDVARLSEAVSPESAEQIETLFKARNLDAVRHELGKLPDGAELEALSAQERYRVHRFRAKFALEDGQFALASELFLKAFESDSTSDQAKQNRVLAYSLMLENARAHELASEYVRAGLTTPTMLAQLVSTSPTPQELEACVDLLSPHIETDETLNLALAHKYLEFDDYSNATTAAKRAIKVSPSSPHANFAAALPHHQAAVNQDRSNRRENLLAALGHYDAADREAATQNYRLIRPEILSNRAKAKHLLGDPDGATRDYRESVQLAVNSAPYAAAAVNYFLSQDNYNAAWELLESVDKQTPEGRFLLAITEYHLASDDEERRKCLAEMRTLAEQPWERAVECRLHCLHWALALKDMPAANECFPEDVVQSHPFQGNIARSWIAYEENNLSLATEFAEKALGLANQSSHAQELRLLADLLIKLRLDEKALPLLEQFTVPGILDEDTKLLVRSAQRARRQDLLLRLCRELRESGQQDGQLRKLEVGLLSKYAPDEAFRLCGEFIALHDERRYFTALRNWLAVRLGHLDVIDLDRSHLPKPNELPPQESPLVALPYIATGHFLDALSFFYGQLRAYFDEEQAHARYISFFLSYENKLPLQAPQRIAADCAVLLRNASGKEWWIVVEDDNPLPSRNEFSSESELSARLLGRALSDAIELPGNNVQTERATVSAIQSKYVRALQDSLEKFRIRFPGTSIIQQIDVGSGENFNPEPILESLRQRRAHVEECLKIYQSQPCALHIFATGVGISHLEAMRALATHPKGGINCAPVSVAEFERAVHKGISQADVVLDISAIITLSFVDGWKHLDTSRTYLVSQATRDLVEQWIFAASEDRDREGGYASITEDNRLLFQEHSQDQREARRAELQAISEMIKKHCQSVPSPTVSELEPDRREILEKFLGPHSLEAICLSNERNAVLWTDDAAVGLVAKADFGVKTIWSQLVFKLVSQEGKLSFAEFNLLSAKLAAWKYVSTLWNAATIISAGRDAAWDIEKWPLKQCVALLSNNMSPKEKTGIALETLRLLTRSDCSEVRESLVVQAILNAIGERRIVSRMLQGLPAAFNIDFISGERLSSQLQFWLNTHLGR